MLQRIPYFAILPALFLLASCESYDFTVNDTLVYTPKPLFGDFDATDPALYDCLKQAIIDAKITRASQLKSLNCSHAGIEDLQGLATFTGLSQLKLSSNKILNLSQVSVLTLLEELYLDSNVIVDPVPLYQLPALQLLDLSHNDRLQCPVSSAFLAIESVKLPEHCG